MKKFILLGAAALVLAGCQTPTQNIIVENSKNVNIVSNNANPGSYSPSPSYPQAIYPAPAPVYAAPVYVGPRYIGPPIYPNNRCIATTANNPYYRSQVCY